MLDVVRGGECAKAEEPDILTAATCHPTAYNKMPTCLSLTALSEELGRAYRNH